MRSARSGDLDRECALSAEAFQGQNLALTSIDPFILEFIIEGMPWTPLDEQYRLAGYERIARFTFGIASNNITNVGAGVLVHHNGKRAESYTTHPSLSNNLVLPQLPQVSPRS
jgi:hypothetical protein